MFTLHEIELLSWIVSRAGRTEVEAIWLDDLFNRLSVVAAEAEAAKLAATQPRPADSPSPS